MCTYLCLYCAHVSFRSYGGREEIADAVGGFLLAEVASARAAAAATVPPLSASAALDIVAARARCVHPREIARRLWVAK
jgi:hypothetical protein